MGDHSFSKSWGLRASVSFSPLPLPLPCHSFFLLLSSQCSWRTRAETLATQASQVTISGISIHTHNMTRSVLSFRDKQCNGVSLPPTKVCVSLTAVYWVLECFSIFSFVFWKLFVMVVLLHCCIADKWHSVREKLWFLTITHEITIHVNKLTFSG